MSHIKAKKRHNVASYSIVATDVLYYLFTAIVKLQYYNIMTGSTLTARYTTISVQLTHEQFRSANS